VARTLNSGTRHAHGMDGPLVTAKLHCSIESLDVDRPSAESFHAPSSEPGYM
jgi:hypothetical protein